MNTRKVKAIMAEKGISPKQLIEKSGVSANVVRLGLAGKVKTSIVSIGKIARALGVNPEEIIDD